MKHLVDVYVASSAGDSGTDGAPRPPVFYLLLASDVFRHRTRGTIYKHARHGWGQVQGRGHAR